MTRLALFIEVPRPSHRVAKIKSKNKSRRPHASTAEDRCVA